MLFLGKRLTGMSVERQRLADDEFTVFVKEVEPRLSYALAAACGVEVGKESTADALAYAWENWDKVRDMGNPAGYLYRVGQSSARRQRRKTPLFPNAAAEDLPRVEPGLPAALAALSQTQRTVVVLLHGFDWSEREVADLLGVHRSTVRRHRERGMGKLKASMEVTTHAVISIPSCTTTSNMWLSALKPTKSARTALHPSPCRQWGPAFRSDRFPDGPTGWRLP